MSFVEEKKNVEILDCSIRDGGYVNNWCFDKKMVREVYRGLSKSGVEYVELGFRGSEKYFDSKKLGAWRFSTEEDLREVTNGIEGAKVSIMGDYGKLDLEDLDEKRNSVATIVRVAVNKNKVLEAIAQLENIKAKGYVTSLQAMGFTSYTGKEKTELKKALKNSDLDYFYIADSYGSIIPDQMKGLFEPFLELGTIKLGFHPHNSLQMAFANTLEAIRVGVDIVDSTIYGMGRGSGNLPTEILIAYLVVQGNKRYNVIPVLNLVDRYFVDIMKETPWGYQLPYMVSGMFKCHPYYAAELVKCKEYSVEDIWKALEVVEEMAPVGFHRTIVENLINSGVVGGLNGRTVVPNKMAVEERTHEETRPVPYFSRHTGKDFLILANGPTLKEYQGKIEAFIDKYDPIVLGANYLSGLFEPNYHAFNNKKRFAMYIDSVSPRSHLLIGENITPEMISEYVKREYEILYFRNVLEDFDIINGRIQTNCRTISVLLMGVAIAMGAKRIFAAGMDGYLGKNNVVSSLFYDETLEPEDYDLIVARHNWNESFLIQIDQYVRDKGQEGIHIITPTSHQSFYKGIENYL